MAEAISHRRLPLEGVRVLDLTRFIAGPYCTMLLADQGAEVVKVEPEGGEETRALEPRLGAGGDAVSVYFLRYNRSKKSVCADLRSERGRELVELLVRHADVLVENFRPGVLERFGLGWDRLQELNERLVYCTLTGFSHADSPLRDRAAFTPIVEALSGALVHRSRTDPPSIAGYPVGDIFPAALSIGAIAMALYRRELDGRGARIDMAMYDAMISMNERAIGMTAMLGRDFLPGVPADLGSSPSGVFRASDGLLTLAVVGEPIWQRFCAVVGRDDWATDERLGSGASRAEHYEELLRPGIEEWAAGRSRADAVSALNDAGVPAAEVAGPSDVLAAEQTAARGMVVTYPTRTDGDALATAAASPIRFEGEPRPAAGAAPIVGEHTREVLRTWAGLGDQEIDALVGGAAVGSR
jgi:crotonobetainyl-CoA:carnitine CoA-transferase CaiB-like acyl-CoA transferase